MATRSALDQLIAAGVPSKEWRPPNPETAAKILEAAALKISPMRIAVALKADGVQVSEKTVRRWVGLQQVEG